MAIVVESVSSTATASATTTLTITKPTGLAEGDLMVAILSAGDAGDTSVGTWNTASGWSLVETNDFYGGVSQSVQIKVATSGDVAASNFSFTVDATTTTLDGAILRCSGAASAVAASDAVGDSSTYDNATGDSSTFAGTLSAYTPPEDGALVVAMYGVEFDAGSGTRSFSTYTVTSGVTLTELYDDTTSDGSGGVGYSATYGVQATATELSAYGATINNGGNEHFGTFVVFIPPINASGSNTLASTTSTTFEQSGAVDTAAQNTLVTAAGSANSQTGLGNVPTVWTVTSKS